MPRIFTFLFVFFFPFMVGAQIRFHVQVPKTADINEQVRVQFVLNGAAGENFSAPSFPDFDVLVGPSVSSYSNVQMINGRTSSSSSTTYTFILSPRHKGHLIIGSATVHAGGKVYRTAPTSVLVSGNVQRGATASASKRNGDDWGMHLSRVGNRISDRDLYFTADVSRRTVYEQEPITLTYRYHARQGVGLANISLSQKPELKGFWTQEIPQPHNLSPSAVRIGGRQYLVGAVLQYLIFPQQTGHLTLPAVSFDCDVAQQEDGIDEIDAFFNGGGLINKKISRISPAVVLDVLPLPTPKPAGFSGGVGHLTVSGALITPTPRTNDVVTYRISVSGAGNLKLIKAPSVTFPKDFDAYAPKTTDNTHITTAGVTGNVQFDYTFVPRNVGNYVIPSTPFVYFDTSRRTYVTLHTVPLRLHIKKGEKEASDAATALALRNTDIRENHYGVHAPFSMIGWNVIGSWPYFVVLIVWIIAMVGAYMGIGKYFERRSDIAGRRSEKAAARARKHLRRAEKLLQGGNDSEYYSELSEVVYTYLSDKLNLPVSALTRYEIHTGCQRYGISDSELQEIDQLLDEMDFRRFAPNSESSVRQDLFRRAQKLIAHLETYFK